MNKFLKFALFANIVLLIMNLSSCVQKTNPTLDNDTSSSVVTIPSNTVPNSTIITSSEVTTSTHEHQFDQQIVNAIYLKSNATCINKAIYYFSCSCGDVGESIFEYGEPLGHSFSTIWSSNDDIHWHDAICEHNQEILDQQQHLWDDGIITQEPSIDEAGIISFSCSVCGRTKDESIEMDEVFSVTFYDYDGEILKEEYIKKEMSALAPEPPKRENYKFIGWDKDFTNVKEDLKIFARYAKTYEVVFINYAGEVISLQEVVMGESAIAPNPDLKQGYTFVGWDNNYENVQSDLVIKPQYQLLKYNVIFKYPDGSIIDEQYVEYGFDAVAPTCDDYFYDNNTKKIGLFSGWNQPLEDIQCDKEIYAQYNNEYNKPVVMFESIIKSVNNVTTNVYITIPNNYNIYAIDFGFNYSEFLSIDSVEINNASPLYGEDSSIEQNFNNKVNSFNYALSCGIGINLKSTSHILIINFSYDGYENINKEMIKVFENVQFIMDKNSDDIEDLISFVPFIIYN